LEPWRGGSLCIIWPPAEYGVELAGALGRAARVAVAPVLAGAEVDAIAVGVGPMGTRRTSSSLAVR
jgi:hypothetical protein